MIFNMINSGGSSGAVLNFDVKAYSSETVMLAAAPAENTIGVVTNTAIPSWVFSTTEPDAPVTGMVWFKTSKSSPVEFNALKKNIIQVYPESAYQYVNNTWVSVSAMSYQGNEWKNWYIYLFNEGDQCTNITSGWDKAGYIYYGSSYGLLTPTIGDTILVQSTVSGSACIAGTQNAIDLSGINTLYVECTEVIGEGGGISITGSDKNVHSTYATAHIFITKTGTYTLDVSTINTAVYIAANTAGSSSSAKNGIRISKIWMK